MGRWVTTAKPSATLILEPDATEFIPDGTWIYYYHTANGVRFAERVEPTGFVLWLQFREP